MNSTETVSPFFNLLEPRLIDSEDLKEAVMESQTNATNHSGCPDGLQNREDKFLPHSLSWDLSSERF